jgi:hypothetical protein
MTAQCVTAIATIVQDFLLFVSAVLVGWYLVETRHLRIASQKQVEISHAQLEAQIRPTLVVRMKGTLHVANVGAGSALNVTLMDADAPDQIAWDIQFTPGTRLHGIAIAAGDEEDSGIRDKGRARPPLLLKYESLSGKVYASVIEFDEAGQPSRTTLPVKPDH